MSRNISARLYKVQSEIFYHKKQLREYNIAIDKLNEWLYIREGWKRPLSGDWWIFKKEKREARLNRYIKIRDWHAAQIRKKLGLERYLKRRMDNWFSGKNTRMWKRFDWSDW